MRIESGVEKVDKRVLYAQAIYGDAEKQAVMDSLNNGWLAHGPKVRQFEEEVADLFGKKYGVAVNSGSSANLLAVKALGIEKGGEVVTPACTFATTVSEIVNNNLVPVFVDSVRGRYTINEDLVKGAITDKTRAILVPQLIGGVCDMPRLRDIANEYNLYLVDDSCDTLAPSIGDRTVASYADVTTTSFYGSHIITAMGMGGMVLTDSPQLRDRVVTLRDWGRVGDDKEDFEDRFNFEIDGIPYDSKFLYSDLGYNLKMNEGAAAFGLEQLKRLPDFSATRDRNFYHLAAFFQEYEDFFELPTLIDGATTNWLAFPLTIREGAPFTRYDFLKHLESKDIQTRVLFSGNITRHPVYKQNGFLWRAASDFGNADYIMANGFLLGCHQGMDKPQVDYVIKSSQEFLNR